jgi:hypothetical protein
MTCYNSEFTHKHHIIPRYMGGSNDASNLVEVTVTQHAMFHFCNYQLWGNEEDRIAWLGLSGTSTKEEYVRELLFLAQQKALDPKVKEKRKKKLQEIGHQQGEKNSQYGKMWIYNLELRQNTRIYKNEPIFEGWAKGRITDFDEYFRKIDEKNARKERRKKENKEKVELYTKYYFLYLKYGFKYIKENFNYDKTQENLVMLFKKYVPEYVPYARLEHKINDTI